MPIYVFARNIIAKILEIIFNRFMEDFNMEKSMNILYIHLSFVIESLFIYYHYYI